MVMRGEDDIATYCKAEVTCRTVRYCLTVARFCHVT